MASLATGAGVDDAVRAIDGFRALLWGTGGGGDVAAVTGAGIKQTARPEVIKGSAIALHPV